EPVLELLPGGTGIHRRHPGSPKARRRAGCLEAPELCQTNPVSWRNRVSEPHWVRTSLGLFLSDDLLEHALYSALGLENGGHAQVEPRRGVVGGQALDGRQAEGLPGLRLDTLPDALHRFFQQFGVEFRVELAGQVLAGLDVVQQPDHRTIAGASRGALTLLQ